MSVYIRRYGVHSQSFIFDLTTLQPLQMMLDNMLEGVTYHLGVHLRDTPLSTQRILVLST
jgi:hypothetical protein